MTRYPSALLDGLTSPFYFIARLTENFPYKNLELGDRALATFLTQTSFHFATYNSDSKEANVNDEIQFPNNDIEGEWNYLYFSFSAKESQAVAWVVFGHHPKHLEFKIGHQIPTKLRLILGGTDNRNYPGFNG